MVGLAALPAQGTPALNLRRDYVISASAENLTRINWVLPEVQGGVIVGQPDDLEVASYDDSGHRRWRFGRNGEGPGEFRRLERSGWLGDTLWVGDQTLRRTTFITAGGRLVRTSPWPTVRRIFGLDRFAPLLPIPLAVYADRTWLVELDGGLSDVTMSSLPDENLPNQTLVHTDRASTGTIVAQRPPDHCYVRGRGAGAASAGVGIPFCPHPMLAVSPNGNYVVTVFTSHTAGGLGTYDVSMTDQFGNLLWRRTCRFRLQAIPKAIAESAAHPHLRFPPGPLVSELLKLAAARMPPAFPPAAGLTVAADGSAWITSGNLLGPKEITIIAPDGSIRGTVQIPRNESARAASGKWLWTVATDDDGLQSVVRYTVMPAGH